MGGRAAVVKAARKAVDDSEYTWAAEILTNVIRIDHDDMLHEWARPGDIIRRMN